MEAKQRPTKAEVSLRITTVFNLIMADTPAAEIRQFCADEWNISRRQTTNYIARAAQLVEERAAAMRENSMTRHLAFRSFLRHRALKNGDNHLALKCSQDEAKLLDLYPAERRELSGPDGGPITTQRDAPDFSRLTDDELEAYIAIAQKLTGESDD